MEPRGALFREIHKNTWLKRLTAEGKKVTVGSKKSDRTWVVFCVHDDSEALLEGYAEPRMAGSHNPEWVISLQSTQHISHALVPNDQEYEFVITLDNEVIRFHAISWEIMQEWVDTLRAKLREMRIISPKENLYTKLPEIRAPLLPTRDPTSPLPATPPVPAAIVPGVERIVPSTTISSNLTPQTSTEEEDNAISSSRNISETVQTTTIVESTASTTVATTSSTQLISTSMSNTLSQNLLNMLSDPISNYSVQVNELHTEDNTSDTSEEQPIPSTSSRFNDLCNSPPKYLRSGASSVRDELPSLARTFANNVLSDPNTCPTSLHLSQGRTNSTASLNDSNSVKVDVVTTSHRNGEITDIQPISEPITPFEIQPELFFRKRLLSSRSLSLNDSISNRQQANNNITELDVENNITELDIEPAQETTTNITIIQVSNPLPNNTTPDIFKFPPPENLNTQEEYKSNVQIIPSSLNNVPTSTAINNQYSSPNKVKKTNVVTDTSKVTTVVVTGNTTPNAYGKICPSSSSAPISSKKVILSTNTSGITNISVGNEAVNSPPHYEKVFLASNSPISIPGNSKSTTSNKPPSPKVSVKSPLRTSTSQPKAHINAVRLKNVNSGTDVNHRTIHDAAIPSTSTSVSAEYRRSPIVRKRNPTTESIRENIPPPMLSRPALTRGVTEAVITARPSRIDMKKSKSRTTNNSELHNAVDRTRSESLEHRRRSSSTSDAQNARPRQANGEGRGRIQQPPQPFRLAQESALGHSSKRLTLREQQVLHLRREIMHPGGVRLQLRRKDCIGSIAWIDAFGAVWVVGWKQKDHPMLYNALHIGDQLISIAGTTISSAAEANKIIRNTNSLFLEILIRRVPFGRVYAIRRELEGQCLGLIRDGNTATIVDVVPKSLAARHGLPPKAQSCDGLSLTFWVLTEINGRPLNLFYKDNEIRDRLNSVGRDISILVQPSDLVAKLKKQLKSHRSHKDYIVQ